MSYERKQAVNFPAESAADLSGLQYYVVKMAGDNKVNITDTAGEKAAGILQNKPESGQNADICAIGVSKIRMGAACSYGNNITSADSGWGAVASSGGIGLGYIIDGCNSGGIATAVINIHNAQVLS